MNINKVFMGGTCNGSDWRDEVIPLLTIPFFNPVVDYWTEECIKEETRQKEHECNIHLYVITSDMIGVYSIAEAIQSSMTEDITTIFHVIPDGFSKAQLKSLEAVVDMIIENGGIVHRSASLAKLANIINHKLLGHTGKATKIMNINKVDYAFDIAPKIKDMSYVFTRVAGSTITICHAIMPNGFSVASGESECLNSSDYDKDLGEKYSKERCIINAENKLWELEGYARKMGYTSGDCKVAVDDKNDAMYKTWHEEREVAWKKLEAIGEFAIMNINKDDNSATKSMKGKKYKQRLKTEYADLNKKIHSLNLFIYGKDGVFNTLNKIEKDILIKQLVFMDGYLSILDSRIFKMEN